MKSLAIFLLISFVTSSLQVSTPESYVAAVVEYHKFSSSADPVQVITNLDDFRRIIREPDVRNADIIVFPEASLNDPNTAVYLPDPKELVAPCGNASYDELVHKLSCAALMEGKYIVINVNEKSNCPDKQQVEWNDPRPCDASKVNIYNTNVVFDRKGVVVAKYRKFNLFGEKNTLKPYKAEMVTFKTDFNVTFGMFICFDLMFEHPPLDLVKSGVKDFIFSADWFSEIPFLSAVQIQQSWAYKNNVNLLAAGRNLPEVGSTGSGIYHGKFGPLTAIMSPKNETKILVATVPKFENGTALATPVAVPLVKNTPAAMTNVLLKRDQIDKYVTELIRIPKDFNGTSANISFDADICHNTFCCNFDFNITVLQTTPGMVSYVYRSAVYSGWRTFDGFADGAVQVCAVFACLDETLHSCGRTFKAGAQIEDKLKFTYLKVETFLDKSSSEVSFMPNTLDTSLLPLNPTEFEYTELWEVDNDEHSDKLVVLKLEKPHSDLLTFALYARDFDPKNAEGPHTEAPEKGSARAVTGTLFLTFLSVVFCFYFISA